MGCYAQGVFCEEEPYVEGGVVGGEEGVGVGGGVLEGVVRDERCTC